MVQDILSQCQDISRVNICKWKTIWLGEYHIFQIWWAVPFSLQSFFIDLEILNNTWQKDCKLLLIIFVLSLGNIDKRQIGCYFLFPSTNCLIEIIHEFVMLVQYYNKLPRSTVLSILKFSFNVKYMFVINVSITIKHYLIFVIFFLSCHFLWLLWIEWFYRRLIFHVWCKNS